MLKAALAFCLVMGVASGCTTMHHINAVTADGNGLVVVTTKYQQTLWGKFPGEQTIQNCQSQDQKSYDCRKLSLNLSDD